MQYIEEIAYPFRIFEVVIAWLLIAVPFILLIVNILTKKLNKKYAVKSIIAMLSGFIIVYLLFFAGEYAKLNLKRNTINRLLAYSAENIDTDKFHMIKDGETADKDLIAEYDFTFKDSKVTGCVYISRYDQTNEYGFTSEPLRSRLRSREYSDEDSSVLVFARESDRNFYQFPLIKSYRNSVSIISGDYLITISYWELKNSSDTVDLILDEITK